MVTPTKFIFGPKKKGSQKKEKKRGKKIEQPKTIFVWPPQKKIQKKGIGATIHIGQEIQYLPYAEFLKRSGWV